MKNEYKKFGYYYEEIMSRINYDLWLEFVEPYLSKGDRVLDLACGTGTFCNLLTLNGYKADGLDLSESDNAQIPFTPDIGPGSSCIPVIISSLLKLQ